MYTFGGVSVYTIHVAYLNVCKFSKCTKVVLQIPASYVGSCDKGSPTYSPVLLVVNQSILHNEGIH